MKLDIHTHILPERWPDLAARYGASTGRGAWIQLEHTGPGCGRMLQGGKPSMDAVEGKVKALVLCYTDISDEAARYNYLPFSDPHRKTPALWVGRRGSDYLKSVSGKATLTLRCDAKLTPDARSTGPARAGAGRREMVQQYDSRIRGQARPHTPGRGRAPDP